MLASLFRRNKGPFRLTIEGRDEPVEVPPKTSILKAALDAGIPFPHSCRAGGCGTCRCRLVEGRVRELTDKSCLLSAEEIRDGYILACQTLPKTDVTVHVDDLDLSASAVAAVHPARIVAARLADRRELTHDILEVTLELDEPIEFTAGQYLDFTVPGRIDVPRSFSFADPPDPLDPRHVRFHVRLLPGGAMSSWLHDPANLGGRLAVEANRYGFV